MNKSGGTGVRNLLVPGLLLSMWLSAGPAWAEAPQWQLAMNDAELRDVVREMSSILGTTVVLDPRVQGRITVLSEQALDREGVRRLFYSVLDAHNFTVIDEGDRILIAPVADARTRASDTDTRRAQAGQFVTEVIGLNTSVAADLAGLVRPLVSVNGYVGPSASANALVVTDTASNVRRIARIVRELDSGNKNGHAVVQLHHGLASELAKVMEQTLGKQGTESGNQVIADTRNNRLVIIGPSAVRQRLGELARSLDTPTQATTDNARVIRLRYSDAKQLAEVLDATGQGLGQELTSVGSRDSGSSAKAVVKADESQNALVIIAEPAQVARRDRQMLLGLGLFLLVVMLFSGLWQPAQQRLETAERLYQQRLGLAGEVQRAQPTRLRQASTQPLSTRLSETATAAGLELQQLDQDGQSLRLTISGDAPALLGWLDQIEQGGALLQSLSLEKRDKVLEARAVWRAE